MDYPPTGNINLMVARGKNHIHKPKKTNYMVALIPNGEIEHSCTTQAIKNYHWGHAMSEEFDSRLINRTGVVCHQIHLITLLETYIWVFCIKRNADSSLDCLNLDLLPKVFINDLELIITKLLSL